MTRSDAGVRIEIDGKLFTEYRTTDSSHVYYWPLIGPGGAKMTRSWPMAEVAGEERDHPHHRSLWFAHGDVNGVDFWSEENSHGGKTPVGKIVHDDIIALKSGDQHGELVTRQKWVTPDGKAPLISTQTLRVYDRDDTERLFDFEIKLTAYEGDVVFGDTKEGSAAIRIAESMRLHTPQGKGPGSISNDGGKKDQEVWGQRAKWVAMRGPVDGKEYEIVFMEHPKSLRHPTRWHARDYGLFAANPFCEADMNKTQSKESGAFNLKAGETVLLKYRILIHTGDADVAARRYAEYVKETEGR